MCSLGVAEDKVLEYYTNIFIASLKKAKGSQNTKK